MPFKWRLKKTRRYDISSKNSFIVGVYLLDNSFLECTLSTDSTGQECLDSIAQRIDLVDTFYFGLRFITKKLQFQWVDLSKPLKKQLDKMAEASHQPPCLYFGVMFYVSGAHKIPDDTARFHYYLQLKNDVIDGRVPTAYEQATRLATFSLQAEYGDYDYERHTVEYFKENNIPLFPKAMTKSEQTVLELLVDTLNMHSSLQGYHPLKAEIQYIKEVQLMDGYGMEYYTAKDDRGKELYLGTSVTGIFARYLDGQAPIFFRWGEIAKFSQNKKMIEIDTSKSSAQYQMEDSDMAKYFARMAQQQQKFYKSSKSNLNGSLTELPHGSNETEAPVISDLQQVVLPQSDSQELTNSQTSLVYLQDHRYSQEFQQQQQPQQQQQSQQQLTTAVVTEDYYNNSQQSLDKAVPDVHQTPRAESDPGIHGGVYSSQQSTIQTPVTQNDPSYSNRTTMLPAYRQAPSYEAVMRHRVVQQQQQQQPQQQQQQPQQQPQQQQQLQQPDVSGQNLGTSQIYTHSEGNAYSQPEIRQHVSSYPSETQYVNASAIRNYSHSIYANVFHDGHNYYAYRSAGRGDNLAVHPTYSSPELNSQGLPEQYSDNMISESLAYQYRPPPPYPRASSSTPDLAVQTGITSANQAPDLLPQQNLGKSNLATQSRLDKSVDNLAEVVPVAKDVERVMQTEQDKDDTSSENSYATFHAKESDSSDNESLKRERAGSEKSKIQVCLVGPKEAPPPSKSKEVATLRESFRRMMIARSGSMNSGKQKPVIHVTSNGGKDTEAKTANTESSLPRVEEQTDSAGHQTPATAQLGLRPPPPYITPRETDVTKSAQSDSLSRKSADSDAESIQCLDVTKEDASSVHKATDSLDSTPSQQDDDGSDSDIGSVDDATVKRVNMGPLKMAAMNGLSLSRPMVLALMNDESRAPKDERRKILESKISEGQVFVEFEEVPKKTPNQEYAVAKLQTNEGRNRFKDVLPYDSTRVKLTPRKDNSAGYINASHIKLEAENNDWWFIATQAPLENTVFDFWQMIWEQEVNVIAMLTALKELGKNKCFPYWPQEPGTETKQTFGDFEVTLEFTDNSLCYVTSRIVVRHLPSSKERLIWHLQYTDWPDHGCPEDIYGFLGFLDEIDSVRRLAESEEGSGKKAPVVVHCSAGVGRTGVVILTMVMKWCLEHNHSVDLPKALEGIRKQRMYMVQTLGQYQFIHKTLIQYLKNTRLI